MRRNALNLLIEEKCYDFIPNMVLQKDTRRMEEKQDSEYFIQKIV